jgi:hypothetical protein
VYRRKIKKRPATCRALFLLFKGRLPAPASSATAAVVTAAAGATTTRASTAATRASTATGATTAAAVAATAAVVTTAATAAVATAAARATTAAAVATAAARATTAATAAAEATTAATLFTRTRFIDCERASPVAGAIQSSDCLLCFVAASHLDETKTAGLSGKLIRNDLGIVNAAKLTKDSRQLF